MVADDDESVVRLITAIAEKEGFQVFAASDGKQAYKFLRSDTKFNGVILDVAMPYIQGNEIAKFMRSNVLLATVPIIMMTSEKLARRSTTGFDEGVFAFLPKPFRNAQLETVLRTLP